MPFTEKALALANMCLVIHVMGKLINILKELSYENIFLEIYFCKGFTNNTHTHTIVIKNMLQIDNIYILCTYNIMYITNIYSTSTMLDIVLYK